MHPLALLVLLLPAAAENAALHLQLSSSSEQQQVEVGELQSELAVLRLQLADQKTHFEEVRGRGCGCPCSLWAFGVPQDCFDCIFHNSMSLPLPSPPLPSPPLR